MKIILRLCFVICICFSMYGLAIGQDYYGGYSPYQGQNSGSYGYSGYDQSYPAAGQYGYSGQSTPQGYQTQGAYDQYPGMPGYGRYDNAPVGSGSYGFPSAYPQSNDPTLRSRLAQPRNRSGSPEVRESTRVMAPSRRSAPAVAQPTAVSSAPDKEYGRLYGSEIYWDGRESQRQEPSEIPTQVRPTQTVNTRTSAQGADNAERQVRPFTNLNQDQNKRTRTNVVRQQNKASLTPPAPPASDLRWGRKEDSSVKEQQPDQPKSSFKWGMQGKPTMIGVEPGRSESSQGPTRVSQQNAQSSNDVGSKKFQWGKVQ